MCRRTTLHLLRTAHGSMHLTAAGLKRLQGDDMCYGIEWRARAPAGDAGAAVGAAQNALSRIVRTAHLLRTAEVIIDPIPPHPNEGSQ